MDSLFDIEETKQDESQLQDIRDLFDEYPMLVRSRETSKCWKSCLESMRQLCAGTFLCAHHFDQKWFNKVMGKYDVSQISFTWSELILRTRQVLNYLAERKPQGFWYPRRDKVSLSDFYCSVMKNGKTWSPFVELAFVDFVTPRMLRKMFGPTICEKLDEIIPECWFGPLNYDAQVKFYKGVDAFHDWWVELPEEFTNRCDENRLAFSKFSQLLELVRQCNHETKFLYPGFTGENLKNWSLFKDWMSRKKGIKW